MEDKIESNFMNTASDDEGDVIMEDIEEQSLEEKEEEEEEPEEEEAPKPAKGRGGRSKGGVTKAKAKGPYVPTGKPRGQVNVIIKREERGVKIQKFPSPLLFPIFMIHSPRVVDYRVVDLPFINVENNKLPVPDIIGRLFFKVC